MSTTSTSINQSRQPRNDRLSSIPRLLLGKRENLVERLTERGNPSSLLKENIGSLPPFMGKKPRPKFPNMLVQKIIYHS